ncbi:riboflavin biosynthesis protein RibF [bacterium]|nr:riboflavin biosynthesis protein RibF [bacterium]
MHHADATPPPGGPWVAAIGSFDGLHRGHQAILATAVGLARDLGATPLLATFHPHPRSVVKGERVLLLTPPGHRGRLAAGLGVPSVWAIPFTPAVAALAPEEFLRRYLGTLTLKGIVVGWNFRYGRGREGSTETLSAWAAALGIVCRIAEPVSGPDGPVSSSAVRRAVAKGDLALAAALLGRPFSVRGTVERGAGRGRALGIPTANLAVHALQALPPEGVYAGEALVGEGRWRAAIHLGPAPTFGEVGTRLEVHLLDWSGDLYGEEVEAVFGDFVRPTVEFATTEELRRQLEKDLQAARGNGGRT